MAPTASLHHLCGCLVQVPFHSFLPTKWILFSLFNYVKGNMHSDIHYFNILLAPPLTMILSLFLTDIVITFSNLFNKSLKISDLFVSWFNHWINLQNKSPKRVHLIDIFCFNGCRLMSCAALCQFLEFCTIWSPFYFI